MNPLRLAVDSAAKGLDRHRDERQRQQRDQRQHRVDRQHQRDRHDEHHDSAGHVHDGGSDHHAHRIQVVGGAGHQVAGTVGMKVGQWQPLQTREEQVPQVVLEVAGRPDDDPPDQKAEDTAHDRETQEQARIEPELATGHVRREIVDGVAEDPGPEQRERGGQNETAQTESELAAKLERMRDEPGKRGHGGSAGANGVPAAFRLRATANAQDNSSEGRDTRLSPLLDANTSVDRLGGWFGLPCRGQAGSATGPESIDEWHGLCFRMNGSRAAPPLPTAVATAMAVKRRRRTRPPG